ncbi:MAG: xanthine dehydrogenase family protein molybdopterin-binding subunit [Candidatus Tectomicrobia bacterium]|nr:xanthine dehydrogenase family protein molybdopterin-binding subunit [Candidatus Tectomicrobia bacterium]
MQQPQPRTQEVTGIPGDGALGARYVGAAVKRLEDPRHLRGGGRFVPDIVLPRMLHAAFLRSPHAHARLAAIDVRAAQALPGVEGVLVGADLTALVKPISPRSRLKEFKATRLPPLATEKVRFVGEALAMVAATSRYVAEDALELIDVEYAPLPPVVDMEAAMLPESALLHEELPDNLIVARHFRAGDCRRAFAEAAHVLSARFTTQRHTAAPLETRGAVADSAPGGGRLTLWTSTQIPHLLRTGLAEVLGLPETQVRVVAPDVGGGFGIKGHIFPEEVTLCAASRLLGRPVKWVEDRREDLTSSIHAREHIYEIEVATDGRGVILGLRARIVVDVGAYHVWPWTAAMEPLMAGGFLPGPYRISNYDAATYGVATNKCPVGPYRGVARPASTFAMECTIDLIARRLDLDPAEVRRRNLLTPEEFPYTSASRLVYDSGDYPACLETALRHLDYAEERRRQEELRRQGRCRGIGLACYVELTALGSASPSGPGLEENPASDAASLEMDPSGKVAAKFGITSHGQSLETTLAQVVADEVGVRLEDVTVHQGDTDVSPYGMGTFASRAAVIGGGAAMLAGRDLNAKLRRIAAHLLEANPEDLVLHRGQVYLKGQRQPLLQLAEVARAAYFLNKKLPRDLEPGLTATRYYDPYEGTASNATHAAVVEVDLATGDVSIVKYLVVEDCGKVINPVVVEGQVWGGVAQGIGGALYEHLRYDEHGQLLTASFMDYLVPSAMEMPETDIVHLETPSPHTLGGLKGMGEGGTIAPAGAITNAVNDALRHLGVVLTDLPLTPERVHAALRRASRGA